MEQCVGMIMDELTKRGWNNHYSLAYQSRVGPVGVQVFLPSDSLVPQSSCCDDFEPCGSAQLVSPRLCRLSKQQAMEVCCLYQLHRSGTMAAAVLGLHSEEMGSSSCAQCLIPCALAFTRQSSSRDPEPFGGIL